ncbi:MAG TPA: hypothetical protein VJU79_03725 [Candidatus Dormibacteraeota bacterium]|nr:hypothetical protein [Candidatus Dormibacteraeota bacterium]
MSREHAARTEEMAGGRASTDTLNGYSVSIVSSGPEPVDLTEMLKGLPNDECPCPHWGYVLKGSQWYKSRNGTEVFGPGDAFFVGPGHTSGADANSEFVIFSPANQMAELEAHFAKRAQEMQAAAAQ